VEQDASRIFTGNIFIYQAFDVGDEIDLRKVETSKEILTRPLTLAKYFKNYHVPIAIDLPHPHTSSKFFSCKIHNFGVISLTYKISFEDTLDNIKKQLTELDPEFQEQSVIDANSIFKKIKRYITQPKFFHLRTSYVVIQVDQQSDINATDLKAQFGGTIASLLHFETETLSEYQKNELLKHAHGYYRGELIIIGTEAAFLYDDDYEELLDLFEYANIQQLELQYFDRKLSEQLYNVYQRGVKRVPFKAYLPFIGSLTKGPIGELDLLKVDISTIIERLTTSIKISGEPYISETYNELVEKLDLEHWRESLESKLEIIKDMHMVYQDKVDAIREDSLTILIIILIFIELVVGILK